MTGNVGKRQKISFAENVGESAENVGRRRKKSVWAGERHPMFFYLKRGIQCVQLRCGKTSEATENAEAKTFGKPSAGDGRDGKTSESNSGMYENVGKTSEKSGTISEERKNVGE